MKSLKISRNITKLLMLVSCILIVVQSVQIRAPEKKTFGLNENKDNITTTLDKPQAKRVQVVQSFENNNTVNNTTNLITPEIDLNRQIQGNAPAKNKF